MTISGRAEAAVLACPLCRGPVAPGSTGCRSCSLPLADVVRHHADARRTRGAMHRLGVRILGLFLYAGVIAWAWWQLPQTLPFVVPAAVIGGGGLHVLRARPWLGLISFAVLVVAIPLLVVPALGTGVFAELTDGLSRD